MSKRFEEEYKEYLNSQAPDLWARIETGIDALPADNVVDFKQKRSRKKKQIRYQNYRTIVSVAACLFALILIVPVYLLVRPAGKSDQAEDMASPVALEDITIQNIEVAMDDSAPAMEESAVTEAPAETEAENFSEEETVLEVEEEIIQEGSGILEESAGTETEEPLAEQGDGMSETSQEDLTGSVTASESVEAEASEESVLSLQVQMTVTVNAQAQVSEEGVLYTATDAAMAAVELFVPSDSGIVFETNVTYTIVVRQEGENRYVVISFA